MLSIVKINMYRTIDGKEVVTRRGGQHRHPKMSKGAFEMLWVGDRESTGIGQ